MCMMESFINMSCQKVLYLTDGVPVVQFYILATDKLATISNEVWCSPTSEISLFAFT